MLCEEGGKIILCESCPNAVHLECIGLEKEPEEWICEVCQIESSKRKSTRSCAKRK